MWQTYSERTGRLIKGYVAGYFDLLEQSTIIRAAHRADWTLYSCRKGVLAVLHYRERHELPEIVAQVIGYEYSVGHYIRFYQPKEPSPSKWLIDEIRIVDPPHKWIARAGEGQWNDFGEFIGYSLGGDWTNRIRYDPPVDSGEFLPHPDAPKHLCLSFRVRLRSRLRFKRKVDVKSETLSA